MSAEKLPLVTQPGSDHTISARTQLLSSFRDAGYRHDFVKERVRSSVALQIRALRNQRRNMTQKELGDVIGMAQTWVSKLENPEYGKMTVATLLRLSEAFDTDLEIKFRPFSKTLESLPGQGPEYFHVPTFEEEFGQDDALSPEDLAKVLPFVSSDRQSESSPKPEACQAEAAGAASGQYYREIPRIAPRPATLANLRIGDQGQYGTR
jgi:transcriptional regulator with XRE-family HTH domain